jgi:hypothetical protein
MAERYTESALDYVVSGGFDQASVVPTLHQTVKMMAIIDEPDRRQRGDFDNVIKASIGGGSESGAQRVLVTITGLIDR